MGNLIEYVKALVYGIVEGITEFLPISSTGHMILLEKIMPFANVSGEFMEMFRVVIQLGAILAVCVLYFDKLNPFGKQKIEKAKAHTWKIWLKVVVGCIPAMICGLLLDEWFDANFYNEPTVAVTLILYGIFFLVLEKWNEKREFAITRFSQMSYLCAVLIGIFQVLAMIPGTSRSGATILGAMLLGVSREVAAEFSFFMAIPIMFGASLLKIVKFAVEGMVLTGTQIGILAVAMLSAFVVAVLAIKLLMNYIKGHDFKAFGVYRIVLGILVLIYFIAI
ncbi:MAG: undecaprenyl-diphosphate phosphatase [Lachnospiraceae bacterium]|nr:undecaprenyl-diphosphate phosphatase [Lachnospiraceae bacterium]